MFVNCGFCESSFQIADNDVGRYLFTYDVPNKKSSLKITFGLRYGEYRHAAPEHQFHGEPPRISEHFICRQNDCRREIHVEHVSTDVKTTPAGICRYHHHAELNAGNQNQSTPRPTPIIRCRMMLFLSNYHGKIPINKTYLYLVLHFRHGSVSGIREHRFDKSNTQLIATTKYN